MKKKRLFSIFNLTLLFCVGWMGNSHAQYIYTTLDDPLGTHGTQATGISGSNIVGFYNDSSSVPHGFVYNGSTFTTLNDPSATNGTSAWGISGSSIVGFYVNGSTTHGFLYNGSSYTTIDVPTATSATHIYGISGNILVGDYVGTGSPFFQGFVDNNGTFTTLNVPGGVDTRAFGISGNNVVGLYVNGITSIAGGFTYNLTNQTYSTFSDPLGVNGTYAAGVSGANIVGFYIDANNLQHGFLYDGTTFTTVDDPLMGTAANQGSGLFSGQGGTLVGVYDDSSGLSHGFVAQAVPEPSSWIMLGLGLFGVGMVRRLRRKSELMR